MKLEAQIAQALAYFSDQEHPRSFELLKGDGPVMLSAPHAVLQTRNGTLKYAERFTGMLCLLLNQRLNVPVLYKTRNMGDDANRDPHSPYRDAACAYVRECGIRFFLDLHQLAPERPMDLCICTGKGQNLAGQEALPKEAARIFEGHGLAPITLDDPFDASSPHTVSATVARVCGIPALQLELNTRLLMAECPQYRFAGVLSALEELICTLRRMSHA